jgi:cytochrome c-type biogenesis protein CcmH/NrfG
LAALAWILATTSDSHLSDARRAVALAERAAILTNHADRQTMDVLAAAYASEQQFDRAVDTLQRAIDLSGATPTAGDLLRRLDLYKKHLPYHEPSRR